MDQNLKIPNPSSKSGTLINFFLNILIIILIKIKKIEEKKSRENVRFKYWLFVMFFWWFDKIKVLQCTMVKERGDLERGMEHLTDVVPRVRIWGARSWNVKSIEL